jgi:hypothetical protein
MTTKPPSMLAASGPADDAESEQITKEHNDDDDGSQDITVDPSGDVTVEASEDVTIEAVARTPHPTLRGGDATPTPGTVGTSPAQRAPTLLGVPISSLPLPGVGASKGNGDAFDDAFSDAFEDATRSISYDEEVTVLAPAHASAPLDPLAALDALDRPSITDDDEEETKVEPAEAAMKAAESTDDVTTALSAQASVEREKALRRSLPAPAMSSGDDLEFADPEAEDEQEEQGEEEESLDDDLDDDDDEVISAGGAIEEEEDDDGSTDGVATATFMKPADSTSLSGLLNPRRPPTGNPYGRDGFGARLPTPYPPPQSPIPAPSTSPFASRLGPAPAGVPYPGRGTTTTGTITAIQVPPPSGKATTETGEPGFLSRQVHMPAWILIAFVGGALFAGTGLGSLIGSGKKGPATPTVIVAKPTAAPAVPAPPVVEPVAAGTPAPAAETAKPAAPAAETAKPAAPAPAPAIADIPSEAPSQAGPEAGLWKPGPAKKPAAPKPHKIAAEEDAVLKPKPAVATAKPAAPKPAMASSPKPAAPAAAKPGKKPSKVWVDPFAN